MSLSLGIHTFGFVWKKPATEVLRLLSEHGFTKFQLLASDPHFNIRDVNERKALHGVLKDISAELVAIDLPAGEYNLASPLPDVAEFAVAAYKRAIDAAVDLECRFVTVSSGRKHGLLPASPGALEAIFRESLYTLADYAAVRKVSILFENHPIGVFPDANSMRSLIRESGRDNISVVYDVANAHAIGENPVEGLHLLAKYIAVVHLSDAKDGKWEHAPLGSGDIDFRHIADTLFELGMEDRAVIEIISSLPLEDALLSRTRLSELVKVQCRN